MLSFKTFFKGDQRSIKAKKNIIASFLIRGIDALIYLLLVPITLGYLNPYEYGVWLTLNSILVWFNSFDIGLGNGLRNKLTIALAENDLKKGQCYVSTTFFMLSIIIGGVMILGFVSYNFFDWYEILGTSPNVIKGLNGIMLISFTLFCLTLIFKFIGNIFLALQMPALSSTLTTGGHFLSLLIIYFLTKLTTGDLLIVAIVYTLSPLIVYLVAYPIMFFGKYSYLRPKITMFKRQEIRGLMGLGIRFFMIQIGGVVLMSISNIIISHQFGPQEVTPYNITYRYFSTVLLIFGIIITPVWSATTDAYHRKDIEWIRSCSKRISKINILFLVGLVFMVLISKWIYSLWIGNEVFIPLSMSVLMACFTYSSIWNWTYSNFLCGLGKLNIISGYVTIILILYYPLSIYLSNLCGINGVITSILILNSIGAVLYFTQFHQIIKNISN